MIKYGVNMIIFAMCFASEYYSNRCLDMYRSGPLVVPQSLFQKLRGLKILSRIPYISIGVDIGHH